MGGVSSNQASMLAAMIAYAILGVGCLHLDDGVYQVLGGLWVGVAAIIAAIAVISALFNAGD